VLTARAPLLQRDRRVSSACRSFITSAVGRSPVMSFIPASPNTFANSL
jgi:hypothetical protein